jgi:hypothetical protein
VDDAAVILVMEGLLRGDFMDDGRKRDEVAERGGRELTRLAGTFRFREPREPGGWRSDWAGDFAAAAVGWRYGSWMRMIPNRPHSQCRATPHFTLHTSS